METKPELWETELVTVAEEVKFLITDIHFYEDQKSPPVSDEEVRPVSKRKAKNGVKPPPKKRSREPKELKKEERKSEV